MHHRLLLLLALLLPLTACFIAAQPAPPPTPRAEAAPQPPAQDEGPFLLADQRAWPGPEGNLAMDISVKFRSTDALLRHLDLRREVGTFQGQPWFLHQILIAMDRNANGDVAAWLVSGPTPLIEAYADSVGKDPDAYDFNAAIVPTQTAAEAEAGGDAAPDPEGDPDPTPAGDGEL
jgi:hypothetical protein